MSMVEHMVEPLRMARRVEVITGAGGRRRWSAAEKARITEEAMPPGAVVSEIARRHGMSPQHLFTWRRLALRTAWLDRPEALQFVPAVIQVCGPASFHEPGAEASDFRARNRSGPTLMVYRRLFNRGFVPSEVEKNRLVIQWENRPSPCSQIS